MIYKCEAFTYLHVSDLMKRDIYCCKYYIIPVRILDIIFATISMDSFAFKANTININWIFLIHNSSPIHYIQHAMITPHNAL